MDYKAHTIGGIFTFSRTYTFVLHLYKGNLLWRAYHFITTE